MAFCIHCGAKLEESHRFCGSCGARVAEPHPVAPPAAPVPTYTAPIMEEPAVAAPVIEEPTYTAPIMEEAAVAAPVIEEPPYTAPIMEEAAITAPVIEDPAYTAPVTAPVPEAPVHTEPEAEAPAADTDATVIIEAPAAVEVSASEAFAKEEPVNEPEPAPIPEPEPIAPLAAAPITREHVRNSATPSGAQPMPFGNMTARGSSASYSYASQERVDNPVKNKAVRPRRKFLAVFCSVLLCILILIMMLPTFVLVTARNTMKQETLLAMMQRIDLDEIPASIIDEYDEDLENMSFAEALCEAINVEISYYTGDYYLNNQLIVFEWEDMTPEDLDRFLDETTFLPFIAEQAEGITQAILSGKSAYSISSKALEDLLVENTPYIVETFGLPVEVENYHLFAEQIMDEIYLGELELPNWTRSERQVLEIVNLSLSFYGIGALCLVLILLVLLLFVANHRDPMYAVRDVGIVCVLGTVLPLLAMLAGRIAVSAFAGKDAMMYIVCTVLSCVAESSLLVVGIVFGLGIVLLVVNGIVRKVQRKRDAK